MASSGFTTPCPSRRPWWQGKCTNRPGSSEATVGVLQFNLTLEPGQEEKIHLLSGLTDAPERLAELRPRLLSSFDAQFAALKAEKAKMVAHNAITTPDEHFNRMANGWLKQQTLYGATWGRWGWMGYRDVVQHAWGVTSFDAPRTRRVFLAALARQYRNGLALRGWNPLDTKVYSDSALWLVATACDYLKETGDFALLEEKVPYHDEGEDTVWGHLHAALEFLENNKGKHDLCLIKFGDWNDSLTAIGKAGRGESIWLSMAYVRGLMLMAELGQRMGRTGEAAGYTARAEAMRKAIRTHAWDGQWFLRCFDDEGRPVGSSTNEQGRIFVNAQSWAMLAGVADEKQMAALLKSCDELLMTDLGYRLVTPPYMKRDDYIGRISYLEPGICENGTIYSHGNAFMIYALLQQGQGDRAYALFQRAAPGYLPDAGNPKNGAPPYIFANCYYGPEHRNRPFQMEFTWVTGSVSWFANAILDYQVGVRREYDGLTLDPVLPSAWNEVRVNRTFRGKTINVLVRRTGQRSLTLNGRAVSGRYLPLSDCRESNEVQVTI